MKRLFAILLALTMIVSIAGFAAAEEDKEITVWFSVWVMNGEKTTAQENWTIMKIARQFEAENPGVKVNMEFQADQQVAQNKLRAAVLAGEAPDIANVYGFFFVTSMSDIFMDITDMIPAEDLEQISGWATAEVDGRYMGYPVNVNEACNILYNKEIVAAAGVDLEGEGAPKNAEELWTAMQKIKDSGKEVFISADAGYNPLYVFGFSAWWSQMSGVSRITSDSLAQTKFSEDEGFLKSLQYCADVYENGFVNKDYTTCADAHTRFINGEGAFLIGSIIDATIYDAMGDNLGVFMLPDYSADVANPGYQIGGAGQAACVLKTCKNPELAVQFLSYVSNHDNSIAYCANQGLSLRRDVTAADLGYENDALYERYIELVASHDFAWNDNSMQGDVANEFYRLSTMATTGQITVEECAAQLDQLAQDVADNAA